MSNQITIDVIQSNTRGDITTKWNDVEISDSYAIERIWEGETSAPEDDKELLLFVLDNGGDDAKGIINFAVEQEQGITIQGVFYEYAEWGPWFEEWRDK